MNIYEILSSKPHNLHYLNRYLNFIKSCQKYNNEHNIYLKSKLHPDGIYMERHHICPKAKDLFPEYKSFKIHPWNQINLTPRQHFIAHLILWKVYGGSQARAIMYMIVRLKVIGIKVTSTIYENIKIDQAADNRIRNSGDGHWSKQAGKIHNWKLNHPHGMKGKKHSVDSKKAIGLKQVGNLNHFFGKSHTEDTKKIIQKKAQARIWITDGSASKTIYKSEIIPAGWRKGRSSGTMHSRIWITNGIIDKHHPKNQPLPTGFKQGRTHVIMNKYRYIPR